MANTDKTYRLKFIPLVEMDYKTQDNLADDSDDLTHFTIRYPNSSNVPVYEVYPTPKTANNLFYVRYWQKMDTLDTLDDSTLVPIPKILVDYALSQIYRIKGDENRAELYGGRFSKGVGLLKLEQKKQRGQPDFIIYRGQKGYLGLMGDTASDDIDTLAESYW